LTPERAPDLLIGTRRVAHERASLRVMRHLALLAAVLVSASACSSDSNSAADANSVKTFDVDASGDVGEVPDPEPTLPEGGR